LRGDSQGSPIIGIAFPLRGRSTSNRHVEAVPRPEGMVQRLNIRNSLTKTLMKNCEKNILFVRTINKRFPRPECRRFARNRAVFCVVPERDVHDCTMLIPCNNLINFAYRMPEYSLSCRSVQVDCLSCPAKVALPLFQAKGLFFSDCFTHSCAVFPCL
jgi:hypothetical protein